VYQLAAVFWYVVTGRHPSGIVELDDWSGSQKLFDLLHRSLFHNSDKRPQNGNEFLQELEIVLNA
jgi:serine/threonine-protein kinase